MTTIDLIARIQVLQEGSITILRSSDPENDDKFEDIRLTRQQAIMVAGTIAHCLGLDYIGIIGGKIVAHTAETES